ncbi:MAG TPA: flotillin domain-containing protein, partial [Planctomycetota bacterium]|nr:flotillin domain-containing protein [Planctomycetota bacterium]
MTIAPLADFDLIHAAGGLLAFAVVVFGVFLVLTIMYRALYKRASADQAFVRTGMGGAKVVVDGGAFVFGSVHAIKWINLETIRLQVSHSGRTGLTTLDNFRIDVDVEFYIHVQPVEEHILRASRSLGDKSLTPETVQQLAEPKLNSVLRAVASTMELEVLFRKKQEFEESVHEHAKSDLEKNGLTLEAVSIVHLDQTARDAFDPNNKFDAEGLKRITDTTERQRKETNEIKRNTDLAIKEKDVATDIAMKAKIAENELKNNQIKQATDVQMKLQVVEAEKQKLNADRDLEVAAATQFREVETFKSKQAGETQRFKYEQDQAVKQREIEKERAVQEANIAKDLAVQQANLMKETTLVEKKKAMQEAQIAMELAVERAKRDKEIGVIQKIREQEAAEAEKLATVAERERAEQNVLTVQKTAEAERERQVAVLQQRALSEQQQIEKQIHADAAAYEIRKRAEAEALAAEQQAAAIERLATAKQREAEALAEGQRKMFEAKNQSAANVLLQEVALKMIEQAPGLVRELMRPAEKISDIKILNVSGMG